MAQEDCLSNNLPRDDKELSELPIDSVKDRVARLVPSFAPDSKKSVADDQIVNKTNVTDPDCRAKVEITEPTKAVICEPRRSGKPVVEDNFAQGPRGRQLPSFEKILPAFVKIVKSSVPKFNGNPLEHSKFKAAFKVEVDKEEVYDDTEKLEFQFDPVEGSAKSCLSKFMPGSDKYKEAWTAVPDRRFGRLDKFLSAAKKRVEKFPVRAKENSEQIRQYQEVVSDLIGVYKEQNFVHELNSQIPETTVAKLPSRLRGRWAEFIEEKPKLSAWHSLANWLEKEAQISESKQRWMPDQKEWKQSGSSKGVDVKSLVTLGLGCLQERQERQEKLLHVLEMWQRSVQFTSLTTRYKSAKSLRECRQVRKRTSWVNTISAYLVCYQVIA